MRYQLMGQLQRRTRSRGPRLHFIEEGHGAIQRVPIATKEDLIGTFGGDESLAQTIVLKVRWQCPQICPCARSLRLNLSLYVRPAPVLGT